MRLKVGTNFKMFIGKAQNTKKDFSIDSDIKTTSLKLTLSQKEG